MRSYMIRALVVAAIAISAGRASAAEPPETGIPELGAGGVISGLILLIGAGMLIADWRRRR